MLLAGLLAGTAKAKNSWFGLMIQAWVAGLGCWLGSAGQAEFMRSLGGEMSFRFLVVMS